MERSLCTKWYQKQHIGRFHTEQPIMIFYGSTGSVGATVGESDEVHIWRRGNDTDRTRPYNESVFERDVANKNCAE
jgi:hypothetical protein